MFSRLKDKFWGKEVFGVRVDASAESSVYLWDKDGKRTLNIRSTKFSYVQGPVRNDGTVTFEISESESLVQAIRSVVEANAMFAKEGGLS